MNLGNIDWRDPATKRNAVLLGVVGLAVIVLAVMYFPRGSGRGPDVFTQGEQVTQPPPPAGESPVVPEAGSHRIAPPGR